MDKFGTSFPTKCICEDLPEDAEFIAQFYKKQVMKTGPKDYILKKFHEYAFKYGIIYEGSNCAPMEEEYKKRKETRRKVNNEIYEKAQEILYRPEGIRSQLLEERFNENAFGCKI